MPGQQVLAVLPALGAAASFGAAGLLQHRAARRVPQSGALRPRLLIELVKIPAFCWGVVLSAAGFGLQITALSFGPLALVQPILATGVLFYLGIAAAVMHQAPDGRLVASALLAAVGLSGFLLAASPASGTGRIAGPAVIPLAAVLLGAVLLCLAAAARLPQIYRVLALAVAAAICYGVTAGLVRSLVVSFDLPTLLGQWQLYVILVLGPAGFLLNQNAFQAGNVGSIAVATIIVGDPVVSILVGALWLGETLSKGAGSITLQVLSLLVMAAGIVLLARRSQAVGERLRTADTDLPEVR